MRKAVSTLFLTVVFLGAVVGIHYGVLKLWDSRGFLNIREVAVAGNSILNRDDIVRASDIPTGAGIFDVSLEKAARLVSRIPMVEQCEVRRVFPDRILIRVTERKPAAVVNDARTGVATLLDAGGHHLGTASASVNFDGLPVIVTDYAFSFAESGRIRDDFLASLAKNLSAFPRAAELRRIAVKAREGVYVTVRGAEGTIFALGRTLPDVPVFNRVVSIADQVKKNGLKIKYIDVHKQNAIGYK